MMRLNQACVVHFQKNGNLDYVRKVTRFTGFKLWMFWVYFAYLALFGIIALVWPSYPGIALTDWIAETFPYGVLSVSDAQIQSISTFFTKSTVVHLAIWQIIVSLWLWVFTIKHLKTLVTVNEAIMNCREASEPRSWTWGKGRLILGVIFFTISGSGFLFLSLSYPFQTWPLLDFISLNDSEVAYIDSGWFLLWLGGPTLFWFFPFMFFMIVIIYVRYLLGFNPIAKKTPRN